MIWLGIETANAPLSVAIVQDNKVIAEVVQNIKLTHSVGAMPAIEEVIKKAGLLPADGERPCLSGVFTRGELTKQPSGLFFKRGRFARKSVPLLCPYSD